MDYFGIYFCDNEKCQEEFLCGFLRKSDIESTQGSLSLFGQSGEYIEFVIYAFESRSIWIDITSTKMVI